MPRGTYWTEEEISRAVIMRRAGKTYAQIGAVLDRTKGAVSDAFRRNPNVIAAYNAHPREKITPEDLKKARTTRGTSVQDLADKHGIDTQVWYPKSIRTTEGNTDWLRVEWALNVPEAIVHENFDNLLAAVRADSPQVQRRRRNPSFPPLRVTKIYVPDAHHGALSWAPETGFNWDLTISSGEHTMAVEAGIEEAKYRRADRVVLRIGDDLFHYDKMVDGKFGATFSGTPQDIDGRWQKMFNVVTAMCVEHVLMILEAGFEVDILIVPGNHDTQTTYYLGKLLEARFFNDERVRIDCRPQVRKDYTWGRSLFIHTHGHEEAKGTLRDLIYAEFRHLFAGMRYLEAHRGHFHHEDVHDERGLTVRTMRALTLNDNWHAQKGYSSVRGAQFLTFDKNTGIVGCEYYATNDQYHGGKNPRQEAGLEG